MNTPQQPGWYDDPHDSNAQRYWDGQDWTPRRQRKPISAPTPPPVTRTPPPPPPVTLTPLPPANPPRPPGQQPHWPPPSQPSGGPPQRSRTPIVIMAVIGGAAVLAVAAALVYEKSSSPPSPDPAQAACNAIHANMTVGGVNDWLASRFAAGDQSARAGQTLTDAVHKACPDISTVVMQAAQADAAAQRARS